MIGKILWPAFLEKINAYFRVSLLAILNGVKPSTGFTTFLLAIYILNPSDRFNIADRSKITLGL
jgi:hypothetical protein